MRSLLARPALLLALLLLPLAGLRAETAPAPDTTRTEIARLLADFLTNNADPARHDGFWADDLVYTSSAAKVRTKAEIMQSVSGEPAPGTALAPKYSAEDVLVRPYGTTAALTFRLVATEPDGKVMTFRNSGTFLYRQGRWQAVTWQATREPAAP